MEDKEMNIENQEQQTVEETQKEVGEEKEEVTLFSVAKDSKKLEKEFNASNKKQLTQIKEEEKKAEAENEQSQQKPMKNFIDKLLSILALPFIIMGAIMMWNAFFGASLGGSLTGAIKSMTIVLGTVVAYALALRYISVGIKKQMPLGKKIGEIALGVLFLAIAVVVIMFREYIVNYVVLAFGVIGILFAFGYMASSFIKLAKTENKKFPTLQFVMSMIAFASSVLLITANFVDAKLYIEIAGGVIFATGSALFAA